MPETIRIGGTNLTVAYILDTVDVPESGLADCRAAAARVMAADNAVALTAESAPGPGRLRTLLENGKRYLEEGDLRAARIVLALAAQHRKPRNAYGQFLLQFAETAPNDLSELELLDLSREREGLKPALWRRLRRAARAIDTDTSLKRAVKAAGFPKDDLDTALATLPIEMEKLDGPLTRWAWEAGAAERMSYDSFLRDLAWGTAARSAIKRIVFASLGKVDPRLGPATALRNHYRKVAREFIDRIVPHDESAVRAQLDAGRPAVVLTLHTSFMAVSRRISSESTLPTTFISGRKRRSDESIRRSNANLVYVTERPSGDYLRLIKGARKSPTVVYSAADGGYGGRMMEGTVFGRPIPIPTGAGVLAYHMNAALFYMNCRFEGGEFRSFMDAGPVVDPDMSKDEWLALYVDYVCCCIESELSGDPRNLGANQGFWRLLARNEEATETARAG